MPPRTCHAVAAPQHPSEVVAELFADLSRRSREEAHSAFLAANHARAVAFAQEILGDRAEAEDAVSQTYLELIERRTRRRHFYRALKANARDRRRSLARQAARCEGLEAALSEPLSHREEDLDPLEILVLREQREVDRAALQEAVKDPRWRYIRRRKWARELGALVRI